MTWSAPARTASGCSRSTATASPSAAGVYVLSVCELPGRVPVFNLTVEGCPEFFASGVLVHNCDAMRYLRDAVAGGQRAAPLLQHAITRSGQPGSGGTVKRKELLAGLLILAGLVHGVACDARARSA